MFALPMALIALTASGGLGQTVPAPPAYCAHATGTTSPLADDRIWRTLFSCSGVVMVDGIRRDVLLEGLGFTSATPVGDIRLRLLVGGSNKDQYSEPTVAATTINEALSWTPTFDSAGSTWIIQGRVDTANAGWQFSPAGSGEIR